MSNFQSAWIVLLLLAVACQEITCPSGTEEVGGECIVVDGQLSIELVSNARPYLDFDVAQTTYDVSTSYLLTELTLQVQPVDAVQSVLLNQEPVVVDGEGKTSIELVPGETVLRVSAIDGTDYDITITRGAVEALFDQVYLKTPERNEGGRFGATIAVAGDTIAIGEPPESNGGQVVVFRLDESGWKREAVLRGEETESFDFFGSSVALEGDTLVVGAPFEDSSARGIDGDQKDNTVMESGAVYVFARSGSTWTQEAYLKASNAEELDLFGNNVALSGERLVVGATGEASNSAGINNDQTNNDASGSGAAYVFARSGGTWIQQAYIKASNPGASDGFGSFLAIDGDTLVVGAASEDGEEDALGGSGAVYVFVWDGIVWSQQALLRASNPDEFDFFGGPLELEDDTLIVGATGESSNARGVDGNEANNDALESGAVYVFERSGSAWSQQTYIKSSNSDEGDEFGTSLALSGDFLVVGSPGESSNSRVNNQGQADNSADRTGAAYLFRRDGNAWMQEAYLKASNADTLDSFSAALDLEGEVLVIGAPFEDSRATNINGDKDDNTQNAAGAAYIFE